MNNNQQLMGLWQAVWMTRNNRPHQLLLFRR